MQELDISWIKTSRHTTLQICHIINVLLLLLLLLLDSTLGTLGNKSKGVEK